MKTTDLGNGWFADTHASGAMTIRNHLKGQRIELDEAAASRLRATCVLADEARLISIEDAYAILSISRAGLYNLIKAGKISTVNIGRRALISRKALDEYLNSIGA